MRLLSDAREPAVTYEKAVWWLLSFSQATVDFVKSSDNIDAMPIEAVVHCVTA